MSRFWVALALVLAGLSCQRSTPAQSTSAEGTADRDIPPMGSAETFEVATWNVEWFGSSAAGPSDDALQLRHVARVLRASAVDLWALQEIGDVERFWELVETLGDGWAGELSTAGTNFDIGYVYRTDVVSVRRKAAVLTEFARAFAGRPPLQIEADVMLPDDTTRVVLITLHMKAFDDTSSYERRAEAAARLKVHIDFRLADRPVIVLGDFNDELTSSITPGRHSPYTEFLADEADFRFVTMDLDREDAPTWCRAARCTTGATIDHVLISDELFDSYVPGSARRYHELIDAVEGYRDTTSDHLPVVARFRLRADG